MGRILLLGNLLVILGLTYSLSTALAVTPSQDQAAACTVTQVELDAETAASGGYEITVEEYCSL